MIGRLRAPRLSGRDLELFHGPDQGCELGVSDASSSAALRALSLVGRASASRVSPASVTSV
ncbi:hypothetical protein SCYAM73S_07523 [Streptomyces cyaneofuscatus]